MLKTELAELEQRARRSSGRNTNEVDEYLCVDGREGLADVNKPSEYQTQDDYTGIEYNSHNIMAVEVKTEATVILKDKYPKTFLRMIDRGSTQWAITVDGERFEHPDEIEIETTGDSECDMLIPALRFVADELQKQQESNQTKWNRRAIDRALSSLEIVRGHVYGDLPHNGLSELNALLDWLNTLKAVLKSSG